MSSKCNSRLLASTVLVCDRNSMEQWFISCSMPAQSYRIFRNPKNGLLVKNFVYISISTNAIQSLSLFYPLKETNNTINLIIDTDILDKIRISNRLLLTLIEKTMITQIIPTRNNGKESRLLLLQQNLDIKNDINMTKRCTNRLCQIKW